MSGRPMVLGALSMCCVSHIQQGLWVRPDTRQLEYASLDPWLELVRILEGSGFDFLFLADVIGVYDTWQGSAATAIREGMQVPANDPAVLISALATATRTLGLVYTSSVLQMPPFTFARQISTLDHLTGGRVGWNVVTSYLANAGANLGFGGLPPHDERYQRAEEYLEVCYRLWEESWEEEAVLRDRVRRVYADPARVHPIHHRGRWYEVEGPHLVEPSPQRTPVLFQAGASERGREFAARHAECVFITTSRRNLRRDGGVVGDIRARAARYGRPPGDIRFLQGLSPVLGGTEEEARAKEREYLEQVSFEAALAHFSGTLGVDLSRIDPDRPLDTLETEGMHGVVRSLIEAAPERRRTFGELLRARMAGQFLTGTPEQVADALEDWMDAGVDGFNLVYSVTPGTWAEFGEAVVPLLRRRGRLREGPPEGTLRERLFGRPRLAQEHPGARWRRRLVAL